MLICRMNPHPTKSYPNPPRESAPFATGFLPWRRHVFLLMRKDVKSQPAPAVVLIGQTTNQPARGGHILTGKGNGEVVALGFTAGFLAAVGVLLMARLVFAVGIAPALGVTTPISIEPPAVYRPLVWGGFWGVPLAFLLKALKERHKTVGFLYFLAPVAALFFIFLPLGGLGFFGLNAGVGLPVYLLIVNAPYGILATVLAAGMAGGGR